MKCIFLHGLGQTPSSWKRTVCGLEGRAEVLCPDLTALAEGGEVVYESLYRAFCEFCRQFPEPFHICGLSLGGILALQYGIENPEKVKSMALIGARCAMPKTLLAIQNAIFRLMPDSAFKETGFCRKDFINLSRSMADLDFQGDLKKLSCPVLVICGERDRANKRESAKLKELIPSARLQMIENAGHEVNVDAPEALGKVLAAFFL